MADAFANAPQRRGWGPHGRLDELLMRIGERLDYVAYVVAKANGGDPKEPQPWRRPGVLSAEERAEIEYDAGAPIYNALEAERAAREAARQAAQQQNSG